jgi:NAD(P)-dependent dehydrogenase (short-subunit alcohol dehydrogenase family)
MAQGSQRFENRIVLVTGAGGSIGSAIACRFADEGADIAIHELNMQAAEETATQVRRRGRVARTYRVDVSNPADVRAVLAATVTDFGGLDIIVNNAATNLYRRVFDFTDEDWARIIGVNLTGPWNYCRYGGPYLVERGGGSIVNLSSVAAVMASYYRVPYMASKGGIGMLTKALALDLAELNIRVNAVAPGIVKTGMTRPQEKRLGVAIDSMIKALTPMRRWQEPVDIANAALFLASDEARNITGTTIYVDGGRLAGDQVGQPWHPVAEPGEHLSWLDNE